MMKNNIIGEALLAIAKDPTNPLCEALRKCPIIQAHLMADGIITSDTLTDQEADDLIEWDWRTQMLDNQDVMQMLRISPRTLQTMRSDGIVPYTQLNGKIYYYRKDIEKILRENYNPRKAATGRKECK